MGTLRSAAGGAGMSKSISRLFGAGLVVVAFVILPLLLSQNDLRNLARFLALVLAVLGVNIALGAGGIVSLGQSVFVGVGAFALVVFSDDFGLPILIALPLAALFTGLVGVVLGFPSLRVRDSQFALVSFGYAIAFPPFARWCRSITGGPSGRSLERELLPPSWFPVEELVYRYLITMLVILVCMLIAANFLQSRWGRATKAQRDNSLAAATFGVPIAKTRSAVLGLSAALSGVSGALGVILFPFVQANDFNVFMALRLYAAAVIGGLSSALGALWGVLSLWLFPLIGETIGLGGGADFVFGLTVLLLSYSQIDGVVGAIRATSAAISRRRSG
ncbi:MAG: branched-chain amino acid ABC transporter permease [Ilumatobacteraceae bacterium]